MAGNNGGQAFSFGFDDWVLAEAGGVTLDALHFDADAICRAYDAIQPVAQRLEVASPRPRIAGFCYAPLAALGAHLIFPRDSEPFVEPLIESPEQIDSLQEPEDYLAAEVTRQRLALARELKRRRPEASGGIGHLVEGPTTAAALIYGRERFFTLPYEDPARAHRLLAFSVRSMVNYARAITEHAGTPLSPGLRGIPDDFAGIFPPALFEEFVVPYLDAMFRGLQATERHLHSELLRAEHLPFLRRLRLAHLDVCGDQYLPPELLRDHSPTKFSLHIQPWHVRDLSAQELQDMYRHLASFRPTVITFSLSRLEDEPKIRSLLRVAREMCEH